MATSNSHFSAAVVVSIAPLCTISPSNQPLRARTNTLIRAPHMPDSPPPSFRYKLLSSSASLQVFRPSFSPPSSFLSIQPSPPLFLNLLFSVSIWSLHLQLHSLPR